MKSYGTLFSLLFVFLLCSCPAPNNNSAIDGSWNLVKLSGGLAGLDCDYAKGLILWTFENNNFSTENTNSASDICASVAKSMDAGTYSVEEHEKAFYLKINANYLGKITIVGNSLTIDGTNRPNGTVADAFSWALEK